MFWQGFFTAIPIIVAQLVVAYRAMLDSRKTIGEVQGEVQQVAETAKKVQQSIDLNTEVTNRAASSAAIARDAAQKAHATLVRLVEKNESE